MVGMAWAVDRVRRAAWAAHRRRWVEDLGSGTVGGPDQDGPVDRPETGPPPMESSLKYISPTITIRVMVFLRYGRSTT